MFTKTFRNTLIASTLFVAGSVLANPAMADQVILDGTVTSTSTVTSTRTTGAGLASALNLYGQGTAGTGTVVKAADLALITNNTAGVTLTATRDSGLTNGTDTLTYKLLIMADAATAPVAADFSGANGANNDTDAVTDFSSGAAARDLYIQYDAPALLDPGNYASTITVSVADL